MAENNMNNNAEQEVDIIELLQQLWREKKKLITWTLSGLAFGILIAVSTPKTYEVKTKLAVESDQRMGGGVGSIASMMGISMDNSYDAITTQMFPDILSSTPFIFGILDTPVITKNGIETDLLDYYLNINRIPWYKYALSLPSKAISAISSIFKEKKNTWKKGDHVDTANLKLETIPSHIRRAVKDISSSITFETDKKTGGCEICVTTQDSKVSKTLSDIVITRLTEYIIDYRTSKARQDVEMLTDIFNQRKEEYYAAQQAYARYIDSNKNVILQSAQAERDRLQQEMNLAYQIYSQVATQLETSRIKVQTSKPVFTVIEPARAPLKQTAPSLVKCALISAFLFCICAVCYILYWDKVKEIFTSVKKSEEENELPE